MDRCAQPKREDLSITNEEIATYLISLYARAVVNAGADNKHRDAVANAILRLGYQWDWQIMPGGQT